MKWYRNWVLHMLSTSLFRRKKNLPLKDLESVPAVIGVDRRRSFHDFLWSRSSQTAPRIVTPTTTTFPSSSLTLNVPSFIQGRDIQHVQHVNTFNETRRLQDKVRTQCRESLSAGRLEKDTIHVWSKEFISCILCKSGNMSRKYEIACNFYHNYEARFTLQMTRN